MPEAFSSIPRQELLTIFHRLPKDLPRHKEILDILHQFRDYHREIRAEDLVPFQIRAIEEVLAIAS